MTRSQIAALVLACAVLASPRTHGQETLKADVTVHADQPGIAVSPLLYGIFYEDINYAADGGLYGEMVQNRSFDYYSLPGRGQDLSPTTAWEVVEREGRRGDLKVEIFTPLHPQNPHYALVTLKGTGGSAGIANSGYDGGLSVHAGAVYDFSMYTRRHSGDLGSLRVALETTNGLTLAEAELPAPSDTWMKREVALVPTQSERKARLVISGSFAGAFSVDMVSLFPRDTFKGRKNGMRKDLAEAIAALKPKVMRFPGGCLIHGTGLDNAYRWKETVGEVTQRRPKFNRWGYHQTMGIGYFEYFQFSEDIGAEPLPILPAGVSCGFNRPFEVARGALLDDMIRDAVDVVEFANGPATSSWGRVRAEMGHPEPFGLKYLGIGNEEHDTTSFREVFPRFVRALRERCPEIKIVGTSGLGPRVPLLDLMEQNQVDISDEHYYQAPEWFIENRNRFDGWKRSPTKIFVGEYASRGNQQFNAVAEAVYLTGIERNADFVVMAAYAPLLARYNFTQWPRANLIWFDNDTIVRTPNYHVQQLFATHVGDRYLPNGVRFTQAGTVEGKEPVLGVSPTLASKEGKVFLKLVNPIRLPIEARIIFEGRQEFKPQVECITLAADRTAENDLAHPNRVAPVRSTMPAGSKLSLMVPPYSVQVLTMELSR